MVRLLGLSLSVVLLAAVVARAEEPTRQKQQGLPREAPLRFDVDRFFRDLDKNKDGYLTRDEVPEALRENFARIDTNKDGKISREELEKGIAYLQPRRRPSDMVYVLIEMSDCDEGCTEEVQRAYDILRKLDKNNDGKIDADELTGMREDLIKGRVKNIFKDLDADKDGKISKEEARGQIREDFDRIDRNHNGFLEFDELLRAATERAEHTQPKSAAGRSEGR